MNQHYSSPGQLGVNAQVYVHVHSGSVLPSILMVNTSFSLSLFRGSCQLKERNTYACKIAQSIVLDLLDTKSAIDYDSEKVLKLMQYEILGILQCITYMHDGIHAVPTYSLLTLWYMEAQQCPPPALH